MTAIAAVRSAALEALRPPPKLQLSNWIEKSIILPSDVSAVPGPVSLYPFQRGIADAIGDPEIERVTLVKPTRVGLTSLLVGAIGSYVANDPAPILAVLPVDDDCKKFIINNLEPTFAASPSLTGKIDRDPSNRSDRSTMLARRFAGGSLQFVAAKSPRNLRAHNAKVLLMDEVDAMALTAEGDPIALASQRTLQFSDRKIVLGSTPIETDTSPVLRSYETSDQRIFECLCLECEDYFEILWPHITWPENQPDKAFCTCPNCGSILEEHQKREMVAHGRWRATKHNVKDHAGFRLNQLVSPLANASWGKLAAEFVMAKNDPALLQPFVNTVLAQGWNSAGAGLDEVDLADRREAIALDPVGAEWLLLTAGVDVQRDRVEVTTIGWAENASAAILSHDVFWGDPLEHSVWAELDAYLAQSFDHELGGKIKIEAVCVDSGDGVTMEAVYSFCGPRWRRKIMAIKGMGGQRPMIEASKSKKANARLFIVGVDTLKNHIADRLERGGLIRFSDSLPNVFFEQLCSERLLTTMSKGQPVKRWQRIAGRAAEALDCTCYAFAARQLCSPQWDERKKLLGQTETPTSEKPKTVIKSNWMK